MEKKVSIAQKRATKNWEQKNPERKKYLRNRSTGRNFIKKQATLEDLEEFERLINERRINKLED